MHGSVFKSKRHQWNSSREYREHSSRIILPAQTPNLVQMQIISSLILRGFCFSSLCQFKWKCISSKLAVSNLACWPRIDSQGRESITNLKICDEAAQKCFTSNTFFSKNQEEKCIMLKLIHTIKEMCRFALQWVISWHKARNVTKGKIALRFKYLLTASIHVIPVKKDFRKQCECPADLYSFSHFGQTEWSFNIRPETRFYGVKLFPSPFRRQHHPSPAYMFRLHFFSCTILGWPF